MTGIDERRRVRVFDTPDDLYRAAASHVTRAFEGAVASRERFLLVLSGGGTPSGLYRQLARYGPESPFATGPVHYFFGDERCVLPEDPQNNFRMARETLLDPLEVPASRIHRMPGEQGPQQGAAAYREEIRKVFGDGSPAIFDLVLLGLGPDGHTASLFPDAETLDAPETVVGVSNAPIGPSRRITLTPGAIAAARERLFLVAGRSKARVLNELLQGGLRRSLPASIFLRPGCPTWVFADRAALPSRGAATRP